MWGKSNRKGERIRLIYTISITFFILFLISYDEWWWDFRPCSRSYSRIPAVMSDGGGEVQRVSLAQQLFSGVGVNITNQPDMGQDATVYRGNQLVQLNNMMDIHMVWWHEVSGHRWDRVMYQWVADDGAVRSTPYKTYDNYRYHYGYIASPMWINLVRLRQRCTRKM